MGVQFVYSLGVDSAGDPVQPTSVITTPVQQVNISQVEVTVTVETPHATIQSYKPMLSTTTGTSLRNMQFRQALQPKPSPTPNHHYSNFKEKLDVHEHARESIALKFNN